MGGLSVPEQGMSASSTFLTYKLIFCMSGVVPIPVIRVNYSGISGECLETARNSPFPWPLVKDGNAAEQDIPIRQPVLPSTAKTRHSSEITVRLLCSNY
jgi:hypothetical protein